MLLVAVRKDVGTLEGLREKAEDVVDDEEGGLCVLGTGGVGLHAIDGGPLALLLVALADDRRDGAASLRLRRHGCECSDAELVAVFKGLFAGCSHSFGA